MIQPLIHNPLWREMFRDFGIAMLMLERVAHWTLDWSERFGKVRALFGRRKGDKIMGIANWVQDFEALVALGPMLFKFIEDARAAAPQLEADAVALKDKVESIFGKAPTSPAAASPTAK